MRSLSYLMKIALITITLYSCKKNDTDGKITFNNNSNNPKSLTSLPCDGGESELKFESLSSWRLIYTDTTENISAQTRSWLKISPNSGSPGSCTITINVSENTSLEDRQSTFSIISGTTIKEIKIVQKPRIAELTVTESRFRVPQEGGNINIGIITNTDLKITIPENSENWISQGEVETKSLESNLLRFNIAASNDGADRNGTILISAGDVSKEILVYQSFGKILILNQAEYDIPHSGENITTNVNANFHFDITIVDEDWIKENEVITKSTPLHTLNFEISENNNNNARRSQIIFECRDEEISDTIFINQAGKAYGYYESTNYSTDGEVLTLQTATVGKGINMVLVGDGFSDNDMETNGKYKQRMREAVEHFFSEEPYKSFRNRYNIYTVKAISSNNIYEKGSQTIFECKFSEGSTLIVGNHAKVFEYALKAIPSESTQDLTIITIINSPKYAGTCYMYANNASISYCPIVGYNAERYRQIIVHEAGGHGFAKLADEYFYDRSITEEAKTNYSRMRELDWYANADITKDPNTIRWAHLLSDNRYADEVDIFEGCLTFSEGAYRPTNYSVMRENVGGFNAPSREAIFKRIMLLSGETYHYENFVAYDVINRSSNAKAARRAQVARVDKSKFVPLAPPVIIWSSPEVAKQ